MASGTIHLGNDGTLNYVLKEDGKPYEYMGDVTDIQITINGTTYSKTGSLVTWNGVGYETAEIRLDLGQQTIVEGNYKCPIVIVNADNPNGFFWNYIHVRVVQD